MKKKDETTWLAGQLPHCHATVQLNEALSCINRGWLPLCFTESD